MKKLFTTLFAAALCLGSVNTFAQDEAAAEEASTEKDSGLQFSGSVDTYYRTTLNTNDNGGSSAPATSFANGTGFNLGMINLVASKDGEKSGFVADLVFGPRGDDAVFVDWDPDGNFGTNRALVNQLYAYWNVSDQLTLTIGNFNTFLGYEVISPTGNFNYSTSYMFSYGPFSHTGVKADIGLTDELSAAVAIMNPTDFTSTTMVNSATLGLQLGYENDMGGAWLNVLFGDQDGRLIDDPEKTMFSGIGAVSAKPLFQIDLTTGWNLTDELYLGFNGTLNSVSGLEMLALKDGATDSTDLEITDIDDSEASFFGAAVYVQYALSDAFKIGFRGEYFGDDSNYGITGSYDPESTDAIVSGSIIDLTLSANYTVGNLTLIPEFRVDMASEEIFMPKTIELEDGAVKMTNSLMSVALAAVYAF